MIATTAAPGTPAAPAPPVPAPPVPALPVPTRAAFAQGVRDGAPFLLTLIPFGVLFGVASAEAGIGLWEAVAFSVTVLAGASQFTALQMMEEGAPVLIILLTALAVNLRMAMYSASLAPFLGGASLWRRAVAAYVLVDATFVCADAAYRGEAGWDVGRRFAYFMGAALPTCAPWVAMTMLGQWLGAAVPPWLALDFAVPICFLATIAPGLRTLPQVAAALTSIALALLLAFVPYSLGLLVAAACAMAAGAEVERRMEARA